MARKFRYRVITCQGPSDLEKQLLELGDAGWRCVSVVGGNSARLIATLEREVV